MANQSLITKLGTLLLGTTGLIGLAGCEAPQTQRQSIYQQPISGYVQQQPKQQVEDDDNLGMAILGGVLGANSNPIARGIGTGILADASKPRTNVQVNVNGQPSGYTQPVQTQTLDSRLLPEYNISALREEWSKAEPKTNSTFIDGVFSLYTSRIRENFESDGAPTFMGARTNFRNSKNEKVRIIIGYNVLGKSLITDEAMAQHTLSLKIYDDNGNLVFKKEASGKGEKFGKKLGQYTLDGVPPGVYHVQCDYSSKKGHKSSKTAVFQVLE